MKTKTRVLVIDDESGFTTMLRLAMSDYEVRAENHPERALQTAREFKPDIILLDVIMPGVDGGDVAAQLRASPEFRSTPIVFLTAIVSEKEVASHRICGGFPFCAKPVDAGKLAEMIESQLAIAAA
jgi:CheY-like chemotaxis protein